MKLKCGHNPITFCRNCFDGLVEKNKELEKRIAELEYDLTRALEMVSGKQSQ